MDRIKVAICDDEKNIRAYLSALVRKQGTKCEISEYVSAEDYLAGGAECDLLFLDIELGGDMSGELPAGSAEERLDGLGLAKRIRERKPGKQPIIIFVTGYERYVYDAFDVDAFQYLVKPVDEGKFSKVFGRAVERILSGEESHRQTLVIQCGGTGRSIPLDQIYYMESHGHKIALHLQDGELEYYAKLGELEEELKGLFCRIHKGYLINLSYVEEYSRTEVTLANGDRLPLSKYKYADFVKTYLRFMR